MQFDSFSSFLILDFGNSYIKGYLLTKFNYKLKILIKLSEFNLNFLIVQIKALKIEKIFYALNNIKYRFLIKKIILKLKLKLINLNNLNSIKKYFSYAPKELGIDLKMLIIGAREYGKNVIVVNFGTALSILTIINYKFIGCLLTSGISLNKDALALKTNLKIEKLQYQNNLIIANNTKNALNLGLINFHYLAIKATIKKIKQYYLDKEFKIIFTSYQKKYFYFDKSVIFDSYLFIKGVQKCLFD